MNLSKFFVVLFFCSLLSSHAQALVIEGEYHATITSVYDGSMLNPDYVPYWDESLLGHTLVVHYWYDTDLAPEGTHYTPGVMTSYTSYGQTVPNWLGMSVEINGEFITSASAFAEGSEITYRANSIILYNYDNTDHNKADRFGMSDSITFMDADASEKRIFFSLVISEAFYSVLESTELGQEFAWQGNGTSAGFSAVGTGGFKNDQPYEWYAVLQPQLMTARVREVSVSEPYSFILLLLGLLGTALRRLRK